MVLEPIAGRCRLVGCLRAIQNWRAWYVIQSVHDMCCFVTNNVALLLDSKMARDSFKTFIPISVESDARQSIIFSFFDLLAAIAAHGKNNGFGGRKLSRMAAWWAFEHKDNGDGFDGGYKAWKKAADATTHLFFAYLRSLSPEQELTGITMLPRSLQKLLDETEYPPKPSDLLVSKTNKLVMIVDNVSPTPFALLRRASNFQYRDTDVALRKFSEYDDVTEALTEECLRVLKSISSANQSQVSSSKHSTGLRDASWSRFEDIGFSSTLDEDDEYEGSALPSRRVPQSQSQVHLQPPAAPGLRSSPASMGDDYGRPTTPSWADFLSTGFVDDTAKSNVLLPPDKVLPPIDTQPEVRQGSSQSHRPRLESDRDLEPGELASITALDLDDAFWWVWMNSLAPEETSERKAAFGRCAVIETAITEGRWLIMEEIIAGAAPEPEEGAYIAEKKGLFSWTKRSKTLSRRKSAKKPTLQRGDHAAGGGSTTSISTDTQAKIHAKAAQLRAIQESEPAPATNTRRGRTDPELLADKTNSVFALQPQIAGEASSAMKWVKKYDKGTIKDAYLSNANAGRGTSLTPTNSQQTNGHASSGDAVAAARAAAAASASASASASAAASAKSERDPSPKKKSPSPPPARPPVAEEPERVESKEEAPLPEAPKEDKTEAPAPVPAPALAVEDSVQPAEEVAPTPPPKDAETVDPEPTTAPEPQPEPAAAPAPAPVAAAVATPEPPTSTEKKSAKEGKGIRKLFNKKKNRASKVPASASEDLKKMVPQEKPPAASQDAPAEQVPEPVESPAAPAAEPTLDADNVTDTVPEATPEATSEPASEPAVQEPAEEATNEKPPAPANAEEEAAENATPPAAERKGKRDEPQAENVDTEGLTKSASPGVQDRWAQIRKNAANRAAHRQVDDRELPRKAGEGEEDTSGEESK